MIVSHYIGGEETKATPTEIDFSNNSYRNVIHLMLMSIAVHSLTVMKSTPSQLPDRQQNLDQTHSLGHTLIGYGLLYGIFLVVLFAISYPIMVGSVLVLATTTATGVLVHRRRRDHLARRRCVPVVGVCAEL